MNHHILICTRSADASGFETVSRRGNSQSQQGDTKPVETAVARALP